VRQIDKQNETDKQEQARADHRKVVAPHDEERVRNEESQDNHANPSQHLWRPETVLNRRATVLRRPYSNEHKRHEDVEEAERKVDALHCNISVTLFAVAFYVDVIESEVGELLHSPVREHDPGHDRVDEEDERVGDTRSDAEFLLGLVPSEDMTEHTCYRICLRKSP
jgi:hypothetical protein